MANNRLMRIAELMHGELCNCDDKRCQLTNEIYDWLYSGDNSGLTENDIPALIIEWREYVG